MESIKYSLIVATLGRRDELAIFLDSLVIQTFSIQSFEVIIVDQNESELLSPVIEKYSLLLNLVHIRSAIKGLSYNRNLGIANSRGAYLCVPDDDCIYYPDTMEQVDNELKNHNEPDMLIGKVFDRHTQTFIFKKTPAEVKELNKWNFYKYVSSITLFFKKNGTMFDEEFGIGAPYHSNEDGELILNFIQKGRKVIYSPVIECNHPPYDGTNMSKQKLFLYGIGFGAMCRKYISIPVVWLFLKAISFQLLMMFNYVFTLDKENLMRRREAFKGRVAGFFTFR